MTDGMLKSMLKTVLPSVADQVGPSLCRLVQDELRKIEVHGEDELPMLWMMESRQGVAYLIWGVVDTSGQIVRQVRKERIEEFANMLLEKLV